MVHGQAAVNLAEGRDEHRPDGEAKHVDRYREGGKVAGCDLEVMRDVAGSGCAHRGAHVSLLPLYESVFCRVW